LNFISNLTNFANYLKIIIMENYSPEVTLKQSWKALYGTEYDDLLNDFLEGLEADKIEMELPPQKPGWYKDAIVYSLYVDLFSDDFKGLTAKLDYLTNLGVTCLWLLPILESPMRDAGFDISNYRKVRRNLLSEDDKKNDSQVSFINFLNEAHKRDIRVIFDIAMNHTSDQHYWFQESGKSVDNPYRDYYIWNKDTDKYKEARLLFKGMCPSNWEKYGDWYFFHRFFEFQPDLNYRNPWVIIEMARNLVYWLKAGVDGFRADAIPYLWKEEGTDCENLPKTHVIVRFFRAVLEILRPHTLLLAEACQKPREVVRYLETEDECNAGYHFPLMPQMFKALAMQSFEPVINILSENITPAIPDSSQWFTFLRCHDELSLELVYVSEEDRKYIHDNYCHKPEWDFRVGEGISARLSELLDRDPRKIGVLYSVMLTLPGTPVLYYGDEFGKLNDMEYYRQMIAMTGKDDTRFLVRGKVDWVTLESDLKNQESLAANVFNRISNLIKTRKKHLCFSRGDIEFKSFKTTNHEIALSVLAYTRKYSDDEILVIQNLSEKEVILNTSVPVNIHPDEDLLKQKLIVGSEPNTLNLPPYSYYWIKL